MDSINKKIGKMLIYSLLERQIQEGDTEGTVVIEANHAGSVERRPALPHFWPWEGHIMISLVFLSLAFTTSHATLVSAILSALQIPKAY